jgi:hypothetical protein
MWNAETTHPLQFAQLPSKYDRVYKAADRERNITHDVNLARLDCSCDDFKTNRSGFPANDARRVCAHIFDKLYSTKAERQQDALVQLFIRYGRNMLTYRAIKDDDGQFVIGFPFGSRVIRVIALVSDRALLASYDLEAREWLDGEHPGQLSQSLLARMRASYPDTFE